MKPITIFEYEEVNKERKEDWRGEELRKIERLNEKSGNKNNILDIGFRHGKPIVRATSFVGVVKIGKTTLEILPKVDNDEIKLATQNLLYLLSYTKKLSIRESDIACLTERRSDFFEILIYLFVKNLWELIKKGMYREYVANEEYAGFLKGKWLISQQLTQQPTTRHGFYVSYDDFTEDNSLNRIFKYAVTLLHRISADARNQQLLLELSFALNDVTFEIITKGHFTRLNVNRLNRQYLPVLELARLFILNSSLQMTANTIETFSFVFDMNRLFEEFVFEFIKRHRDDILPEDLKDCEIRAQFGNKCLVYTEDGEEQFQLRPDIVFIKADRSVSLIIDTKYKLIDSDDRKFDISQGDMYQMFAYAKRYDCNKVIMLYPFRKNVEETKYYIEEKWRKQSIDIRTINIGIDLREDKQTLIAQLKSTIK